jgi:hypothetical protein
LSQAAATFGEEHRQEGCENGGVRVHMRNDYVKEHQILCTFMQAANHGDYLWQTSSRRVVWEISSGSERIQFSIRVIPLSSEKI